MCQKINGKQKEDYKKSIFDTIISISIGGVISLSIIITSASVHSLFNLSEIKNAVDLGNQLSPILGNFQNILYQLDYFVLE